MREYEISINNYGFYGARGAWEVEHSVPRSRGGRDHLNNLYPACISCNRNKAVQFSRVARSQYGRKRAPYSREKKEQIRRSNAVTGGMIGSFLASIGGPWGIAVGAVLGSEIGHALDPND